MLFATTNLNYQVITAPCDANITTIARLRKITGKMLSLVIIVSLNGCLSLKEKFVRKANTKGKSMTIKILSTRKESSITPVLPLKTRR